MTRKKHLSIIITLANQKGGVGKSTLAVNLAAMLADWKFKTLLVDSDSQKSASNWFVARTNRLVAQAQKKKTDYHPTNLQSVQKHYDNMEREAVLGDIAQMAKDYDFIVVDTPGKSDKTTLRLMAASNLVIIPIAPGDFDFWGSETTREQLLKLVETGQIEARIILSRLNTNPKEANTIEAIREVHTLGLPVMKTQITNRSIYSHCASGYSVFELKANTAARNEMKNLYHEVISILLPNNNKLETAQTV